MLGGSYTVGGQSHPSRRQVPTRGTGQPYESRTETGIEDTFIDWLKLRLLANEALPSQILLSASGLPKHEASVTKEQDSVQQEEWTVRGMEVSNAYDKQSQTCQGDGKTCIFPIADNAAKLVCTE
jgi:hypothetical protein